MNEQEVSGDERAWTRGVYGAWTRGVDGAWTRGDDGAWTRVVVDEGHGDVICR